MIIDKKSLRKYRLRPTKDFFEKAELEEIYVLTEHWISDMLFYKDELTFFNHLVDRYFVLLLKEAHINEAQIIVTHIHELEKTARQICEQMDEHISHIEDLYENEAGYDDSKFRAEHSELEEALVEFVQKFTETKREVFGLSRKMIEVDKLSHLLTA